MVSREGLVLPQHFKNHREYLHLLSGTETIVEWLEVEEQKPSVRRWTDR